MHSALEPMHIPDGFLSSAVALLGWGLAIILLGAALRQTRRQLGERQVPVMGVLAAFIFAAQAVNFPVAAGTSGHLIGAALAAIALGPWAAVLVMTAVVAVQALLFQDGGLIVMGWNLVNMAGLAVLGGYASYRGVLRLVGGHRGGRLAAAFAAAWVSVEVGAVATAVELAASGTTTLSFGLPAMASVHALIGLGEGVITVGALALLLTARPEILREAETSSGQGAAHLAIGGLLLALVVALAAPWGSTSPDGLNAVAEALEFSHQARSLGSGLFPGYQFPGLDHPAAATLVAVGLGTLIVFSVAVLAGRGLRPRTAK